MYKNEWYTHDIEIMNQDMTLNHLAMVLGAGGGLSEEELMFVLLHTTRYATIEQLLELKAFGSHRHTWNLLERMIQGGYVQKTDVPVTPLSGGGSNRRRKVYSLRREFEIFSVN